MTSGRLELSKHKCQLAAGCLSIHVFLHIERIERERNDGNVSKADDKNLSEKKQHYLNNNTKTSLYNNDCNGKLK